MKHEGPSPGAWEAKVSALQEAIGGVTMLAAEIEESIDELLIDLLTTAPVAGFFKRRVLGRMALAAKVELLTAYAAEFADGLCAPDIASTLLRDIRIANEDRNRLVHDLHEVDILDGSVTRRRIWEDEATPIDLDSYVDLNQRLHVLVVEGLDAIADALAPAPSN